MTQIRTGNPIGCVETPSDQPDLIIKPIWTSALNDGEYFYLTIPFMEGISQAIKDGARSPEKKPQAFFIPKGKHPELAAGVWQIKSDVFLKQAQHFHRRLWHTYRANHVDKPAPTCYERLWYLDQFTEEVNRARQNTQTNFFLKTLTFNLYRLRNGALALQCEFHARIIEQLRHLAGRYETNNKDFKVWRFDNAEAGMVAISLASSLNIPLENIKIHEGIYQIQSDNDDNIPSLLARIDTPEELAAQQAEDNAIGDEIDEEALDDALSVLTGDPVDELVPPLDGSFFDEESSVLPEDEVVPEDELNRLRTRIDLEGTTAPIRKQRVVKPKDPIYEAIAEQKRPYAKDSLNKFISSLSGQPLIDYQVEGVKHIVSRRSSLLADSMGTGKTAQSLVSAAFLTRKSGKILVVASVTAISVWPDEIARVMPHKTHSNTDLSADFLLTTFTSIKNFTKEDLADRDVLLIDEAHHLKDKTTSAFINVIERTHHIPHKCVVTATPVMNRAVEIHSMLALSGHPLGELTEKTFLNRYGKTMAGLKELNKIINKSWMIRRLKEDVLNLPPKIEHIKRYALSKAESVSYNALMSETGVDSITKMHTLRRFTEELKVKRFIKDAKNFKAKDSHIVFVNYVSSMADLAKQLKEQGITCAVMESSYNAEKRKTIERDFQAGRYKVLIGTYFTCGESLTLTKANHVHLLGLPWTYTGQCQAEDRAHRMGQLRDVNIHIPLYTDTIDDGIYQLIRSKEMISSSVLDAGGDMDADKDVALQMVNKLAAYLGQKAA